MAIKNKHWIIMFVCCAVATLAIIILLKYFNIGSLAFLLILLCPLSHILLMKLFPSKQKVAAERNENHHCH